MDYLNEKDEEASEEKELSQALSDMTLSASSMAVSEEVRNSGVLGVTFYPEKQQKLSVQRAMKCLCCKTNMEFTRVINSEMQLFECRGCGAIEGAETAGALVCPKCNFKLCKSCRFCPNGHFLKKVFNLVIQGQPFFFNPYSRNKAVCSICDVIIENQLGLYHCWPCTFNVCLECMRFSKGKFIESSYSK